MFVPNNKKVHLMFEFGLKCNVNHLRPLMVAKENCSVRVLVLLDTNGIVGNAMLDNVPDSLMMPSKNCYPNIKALS